MKYSEQANPFRQILAIDRWFPGAREWEKLGLTATRYGVPFCGNEDVLELDSGDGCTLL